MAKTMAKAKKAEGWANVLPERVAELRSTVEKRVRKGLEQATDLLPAPQRKAVHKMRANLEHFRHDLRKRGEKAVTTLRKRVDSATAEMRKRVEGAVTPLSKRFDVASRADVDRLRKRLEHLERRLGHKAEAV